MQAKKKRASVEAKGSKRDIIQTILAGELAGVKALIKSKENVNCLYKDPRAKGRKLSPVHLAVELGNANLVQALLEGGANVNLHDSQGGSPLASALNLEEPMNVLGTLLWSDEIEVDAPSAAGTPVYIAVAHYDNKSLQMLLDKGACASNDPPILFAAKSGNVEALQLLVAKGGKLDVQDEQGFSSLMILLGNGHVQAVLDFMTNGLQHDLNVQNSDGWTLLMLACNADEERIARTCLEKGCSVDMRDKLGDSAVHQTLKRGQWHLSKLLLQYLQKDCSMDDIDDSILLMALGAGEEQLAETLLQRGVDCSSKQRALLDLAFAKKFDGVAAKLIRICGIDLMKSMQLCLQHMLDEGLGKAPVAYIDRFCETLGSINNEPVDADGNTRLHVVAQQGYAAFAAELGRRGLDPNNKNSDGDTPLHLAAKNGNLPMCKTLVAMGADVLCRNKKNKTPRAQSKISQATKDYLLDAEEEAKELRKQKASAIWDKKMQATQTESAFGVRVV